MSMNWLGYSYRKRAVKMCQICPRQSPSINHWKGSTLGVSKSHPGPELWHIFCEQHCLSYLQVKPIISSTHQLWKQWFHMHQGKLLTSSWMVTTLPIDVPKTLHLEVNTFSSSLVCHRFFFLILGAPKNGTADFAPKQHQVTSRSRFSRLPKNSNKSNPSSKSMGQPSRPFPQKHSQRNFPLPPSF